MKKIFITIITMFLSLQASAADNSHTTYINGIYYYFSGKTAYVTSKYREPYAEYSSGDYSGDVVIPSKVTYNNKTYTVGYINQYAFNGCKNLTSVTIPNTVTGIGENAFDGCSNLISINIPSSVTSIDDEAFWGCYSLKSVHITDLNAWCNINSHSNPLMYAHHLFMNGKEITNLVIPSNLTSIRSNAFIGCTGFNSISVESGNPIYDSRNNCNAIIEKSTNSLVLGCKNTTIPSSVTSISDLAFSGCSSLTSITIPNSVTSIGGSAFYGCSGLTSITIPNSVTSIGSWVFSDCSSLASITIPNSVTNIGDFAFVRTEWYNNLPDGVVYAGKLAYKYKGEMSANTHITLKEGTLGINNYAFLDCRGLTSIIIPSSVTFIGDYSFLRCSDLKYVCLTSDKLPSIGTIGNVTCQFIMPYKAYKSGIPQEIKNYATYNDKPMYIQVKSKTATSAVLELRPIDTTNAGFKGSSYSITLQGLAPATSISASWKVDPFGSGIVNIPDVKTNDLVMNVQPAKAVSTTKARLSATVSEANDDKRYGFEWLRYDAPENMTPNRVCAPLYNGQIVGTLSNLNPDIYYKYRPFYKADDGTMFQGEWEAFITGDANVFFEPEVHTNEPVALTKDGAQLSGVWLEGTEDIQEKGFEYWPKNSGARPSTRGTHVTAVIVKGNETSVTLEGLEAGTEYVYRSYLKTASGTTYGEEMTFKTPLMGDANDDGVVNVADIVEINNAKAGNPSASFNMTNADTDGNGTLTEADITATENIIMK